MSEIANSAPSYHNLQDLRSVPFRGPHYQQMNNNSSQHNLLNSLKKDLKFSGLSTSTSTPFSFSKTDLPPLEPHSSVVSSQNNYNNGASSFTTPPSPNLASRRNQRKSLNT